MGSHRADPDAGDIRHYLQHHLDPDEEGTALLALVYLAGRADLVGELTAGFEDGEHPTTVFNRAARADTDLAARFGLEPAWGTGLPADYQPPEPTLQDLIDLRERLTRPRQP